MEVEEVQAQGCKFPRMGNGRSDINKIGQKGEEQQCPDDEDDGEVKRNGVGFGRLCSWPSSRIVRVSRASGGKDRHSKVWTSKGLRDRRVRLSVPTAIQFYDLQDRLGYDQPSKAVEWLLKAAASSIAELPSINTSFPDTPKQLSDEKRSEFGFESAEVELDGDSNYQQQHVSLSKSACSSNSETSKGSGLSLSRSESRMKARERARERTAEKEKENESHRVANVNPISQSSFTELLTSGINSIRNSSNTSPNESAPPPQDCEQQFFQKMDYFTSGLLGSSSSSRDHHHHHHHHSSAAGFTLPQSPMAFNHPELQHFSFVPDHLAPVVTASGGASDNYNLNFTISSGLAGFNRGTLQSNSPSHQMPNNLQRFSLMDGSSNVPFFIGSAAAPNAAAPNLENHHHHQHQHHQFPPGLDGRLQLCYGDGGGGRHSDQKGKGKN